MGWAATVEMTLIWKPPYWHVHLSTPDHHEEVVCCGDGGQPIRAAVERLMLVSGFALDPGSCKTCEAT